MNRWLALLLLLPGLCSAQAMQEGQYGVGQTFLFRLFNTDGTLDVDEADGGAEVTLMCDEAAPVNPITNDFVDEGTAYSIALTAAEMECARIEVHVGATTANSFIIYTYGDLRAHDKTRGIASGVAQTTDTDTTTFQLDADVGATWADDELNGALIVATAGTGAGERCHISDWVSATDEATCSEAMGTDPTNDTEYIVYPQKNAIIEVNASGYVSSNQKALSDDTTAANNAELFFDGTNTMFGCTIATSATTPKFTVTCP